MQADDCSRGGKGAVNVIKCPLCNLFRWNKNVPRWRVVVPRTDMSVTQGASLKTVCCDYNAATMWNKVRLCEIKKRVNVVNYQYYLVTRSQHQLSTRSYPLVAVGSLGTRSPGKINVVHLGFCPPLGAEAVMWSRLTKYQEKNKKKRHFVSFISRISKSRKGENERP